MTEEIKMIMKFGIEFSKNESKGWYQLGITYYNGGVYWQDICDSIMTDDDAREEHHVVISLIFFQIKIGRFYQLEKGGAE